MSAASIGLLLMAISAFLTNPSMLGNLVMEKPVLRIDLEVSVDPTGLTRWICKLTSLVLEILVDVGRGANQVYGFLKIFKDLEDLQIFLRFL